MSFFDLCVPYLESDSASAKDNASHKASRLKVVVKAMELGYSGIAYDRNVRGVMSEKDRCSIPPFPLSSLLKVSPTLSASVDFHRRLVGAPLSDPFRQYKRLTVAADSISHVAVLNSGNPVLRTYDLIAVRPLNQAAFDQACSVAEVDLIAIDFSQKLPFRLKLPMVKAAIERGICFEITYSHFISNVQCRRQMLSNAKMLVDWTRGKNIIFSSAATTADGIRGPYDVANLSSLLGLSSEQSKAAVSKNCRILLNRSLRKKQHYKEAIRIEKLSPAEQVSSRYKLFSDWSQWDPISSGDGDLPPVEAFVRKSDDAIKVPANYFNISIKVSNSNAQKDLVSFKNENSTFIDSSGTTTPKLESSSMEDRVIGDDKLDDVLTNNEVVMDSAPFFCTPTKEADDVAQHNELVTPAEFGITIAGAFTSTPTSSLWRENISKTGEIPGYPNINLTLTPSEQVDSLNNIGSPKLYSPVVIVDIPSPDKCELEPRKKLYSPVVIDDIPSPDKCELEPRKELEMSCVSPMDTNDTSNNQGDNRPSAAKEVSLSSSMSTVEEATATKDEKIFTLSSCNMAIHEGISSNISKSAETNTFSPTSDRCANELNQDNYLDEQETCVLQDTSVTPMERCFNELKMQSNCLLTPHMVDIPNEENWMAEEHPGPSAANKKKQGKGRFMKQLRREALWIPSKGLFKPLLFRRKISQCNVSRKRQSRLNHDVHL